MAFETLRRPLFIVGIVLFALALLVELGSNLVSFLSPGSAHGIAIRYLALINVLIMLALIILALSLFVTDWVLGPGRAITNLIVSILVLIASFLAAVAAFSLILMLVTLLFAVFFGTIAYFAVFVPQFSKGAVAGILSLLMLLKIAGSVCLILSQPRFLESKGLVLIVASSIGCVFLIGFLYALVPGFLLPIIDGVAGLVIAIVAIIWAVIYLIGAIVGLVKLIV